VIGSLRKTLTAAGTVKVAVKLELAARRKLAHTAILRATLAASGRDAARNVGTTSVAIVIRR